MSGSVTLTCPAQTENIALARSLAAAMAARADLTLERVEDLRLAVDEAVSEAISAALPGSQVSVNFTLSDEDLIVDVAVDSDRTEPPSPTSFGWTVLTALVDEARARMEMGQLLMTLRMACDPVDA